MELAFNRIEVAQASDTADSFAVVKRLAEPQLVVHQLKRTNLLSEREGKAGVPLEFVGPDFHEDLVVRLWKPVEPSHTVHTSVHDRPVVEGLWIRRNVKRRPGPEWLAGTDGR